MNDILQSPFTHIDRKWYFLSLFYAHDKWADLIVEIIRFCHEHQSQFSICLFSFSKEKGENIQLTLASSINDNNNYIDEIQSFFQKFFSQNPSVSCTLFPYGKAVWCDYPNNSLVWNLFRLSNCSDQYVRFHNQTVNFSLSLLDSDFSEDSIFSLGIYLLAKSLSSIEKQEQQKALTQALQNASVASPHFVYAANELILGMDADELEAAIDFYINEPPSDYSMELINWLSETKNFLKNSGFHEFCNIICKITGLSGLRQLIILYLINNWYDKRFD